jgi:plasmid stability protein
MATLNVKNLSDALYRKLQKRARQQHRSVAQEVKQILSEALDRPEPVPIMSLEGLGKEIWRGIDAAEYVENERRSWD